MESLQTVPAFRSKGLTAPVNGHTGLYGFKKGYEPLFQASTTTTCTQGSRESGSLPLLNDDRFVPSTTHYQPFDEPEVHLDSWWDEFIDYGGTSTLRECESFEGWSNPQATVTPAPGVVTEDQTQPRHLTAIHHSHDQSEGANGLSQGQADLWAHSGINSFDYALKDLEQCPSLATCDSTDLTMVTPELSATVLGLPQQYGLQTDLDNSDPWVDQTFFKPPVSEPSFTPPNSVQLDPSNLIDEASSSYPPIPDFTTNFDPDFDLGFVGSLFETPVYQNSQTERNSFQHPRNEMPYEQACPSRQVTPPQSGYSPMTQQNAPQESWKQSQVRRGNAQRDKSRDEELLEYKNKGWKYSDIKAHCGFQEAESTLRGRVRALTKPKEQRVRKPEWSDADISNLKQVVSSYRIMGPGNVSATSHSANQHKSKAQAHMLSRIPWKAVAKSMAERGGYHYGPATVKKKYIEVMGFSV